MAFYSQKAKKKVDLVYGWLSENTNHSLSYLLSNLQVKSFSVWLEENRPKFIRKDLAVSHNLHTLAQNSEDSYDSGIYEYRQSAKKTRQARPAALSAASRTASSPCWAASATMKCAECRYVWHDCQAMLVYCMMLAYYQI